MKTRYFLLSALAAAAVVPGTASAKLILDMPPILAASKTPCTSDTECTSSNFCCEGFCRKSGFCCGDQYYTTGFCCGDQYYTTGFCCGDQYYTTGFCCGDQYYTTGFCCNGIYSTDPCPSSATGTFNDTGITNSLLVGDDAEYGRDKAAADGTLTKIGSGHAGFDFSAVSGNCVQDNATGLLWSPDQGSAMTYTTAESKADDANTNSLCGQSSGWRIPNLRELLSLVSYGAESYNAGKTIDSTFFSDTQVNPVASFALWYWTATPYSSTDKWGVSFQPKYNTDNYTSSVTNVSGSQYLRLVNGTELKGSFTPDDTNGTVTDENAKLTWKRCFANQTWSGTACTGIATPYTWANALALTANGWRLPNIKELQSINGSTYFPAPTADTYVWSSSPYAGNTNNIWVINVKDGTFWNSISKDSKINIGGTLYPMSVYVRLVKDVQ